MAVHSAGSCLGHHNTPLPELRISVNTREGRAMEVNGWGQGGLVGSDSKLWRILTAKNFYFRKFCSFLPSPFPHQLEGFRLLKTGWNPDLQSAVLIHPRPSLCSLIGNLIGVFLVVSCSRWHLVGGWICVRGRNGIFHNIHFRNISLRYSHMENSGTPFHPYFFT